MMLQFVSGEHVQVVNPPEHCLYLDGQTATVVKQINDDRYLLRLDARQGIPRGRWQLYYITPKALAKAN